MRLAVDDTISTAEVIDNVLGYACWSSASMDRFRLCLSLALPPRLGTLIVAALD